MQGKASLGWAVPSEEAAPVLGLKVYPWRPPAVLRQLLPVFRAPPLCIRALFQDGAVAVLNGSSCLFRVHLESDPAVEHFVELWL